VEHFTRAVLHAIHLVFPPASITKHHNDEPIALKKLTAGDGLWTTRKEILGWLFDGLAQTITLLPEKIASLAHNLCTLACQNHAPVYNLQQIQGHLIHASYGIPAGKGLLLPIVALMAKHASHP